MEKPIFDLTSVDETNFNEIALAVFRYQYVHNQVYGRFVDLLKVVVDNVKHFSQIPFLPISFFKTHRVICGSEQVKQTFLSSGTTGMLQSKHLVTDVLLYEQSYLGAFQHFYGAISDYVVLALLPSYLEREGSSLIYMVEDLIKKSNHEASGFYLHNHLELHDQLLQLEKQEQKILLIGVSFALLDFVEKYPMQLQHTIVMETGGMKGQRKEMIRAELHEVLKVGFGVTNIHSEYGMTELLSQAYFTNKQQFECPSWMKILIRDTEDALSLLPNEKSGGLNVIDLANLNSCAFIATQDLGKLHHDGSFEVLGRFDNSDIRGCNLLIS